MLSEYYIKRSKQSNLPKKKKSDVELLGINWCDYPKSTDIKMVSRDAPLIKQTHHYFVQ